MSVRKGWGSHLSPTERFWRQTVVPGNPNECWGWRGSLGIHGYGMMAVHGEKMNAHRAAWLLLMGTPIPEGFHVDHLCRNRACVNPNHLEPVSAKENSLRGNGRPAVNARKTHCLRGHAFTPENTGKHGKSRRCRECDNLRGREARRLKHEPQRRVVAAAELAPLYRRIEDVKTEL